MFQVAAETVDLIYQAQLRPLQGWLRLDVSSSQRPMDLSRSCDREAARVAIGERLLRLVGNLAEDAVLTDPSPPPTAILLMPTSTWFHQSVVDRLVEVLGLDSRSQAFQPALEHLAQDFFSWANTENEARQEYGIEVENDCVSIACEPFTEAFRASGFTRGEPPKRRLALYPSPGLVSGYRV